MNAVLNPLPEPEPALAVDKLRVRIALPGGRSFDALQDVSFAIEPGEIVGVVGESGSGKSVLAKSIMGLLPPVARVVGGGIRLNAQDLLALDDAHWRALRGADLAMVFQDPMTSLNPVLRVGNQLAEAVRLHQPVTSGAARARVRELLAQVGIAQPEARARQYPHEFSGGMRQRAMIAMGVANSPALLIADEPTTALDVTVQLQILRLLRELNRNSGTSVMFITHNMGVVATLCDRVVVMYSGRVVEQGPVDDIFAAPRHPYTWALLNAVPRLDRPKGGRLYAIPGQAPDPASPPAGCRFAPRCPHAIGRCHEAEPPDETVAARHTVRCWVKPNHMEAPHAHTP
jgi:peptide/nickel transport system ATP-binding protein